MDMENVYHAEEESNGTKDMGDTIFLECTWQQLLI
jgi:hypothetical protein